MAPLADLDRKLLDEFADEIGAPSGLVAQNIGISVADVTRAAKKLAELSSTILTWANARDDQKRRPR